MCRQAFLEGERVVNMITFGCVAESVPDSGGEEDRSTDRHHRL